MNGQSERMDKRISVNQDLTTSLLLPNIKSKAVSAALRKKKAYQYCRRHQCGYRVVQKTRVISAVTVVRHHNSSLYSQKPNTGGVSCANHNSQCEIQSSLYHKGKGHDVLHHSMAFIVPECSCAEVWLVCCSMPMQLFVTYDC